eukprot:7316412-Pyramimonas_sp.AAC.1
MSDVIMVLAHAEEFSHMKLRRTEKKHPFLLSLFLPKVLNEINSAASTQNHLEGPGKKKSTAITLRKVQNTADKVFVLVNEACTDNPCEKLDFSLRKEIDVICDAGVRVAKALGQFCIYKHKLAATAHALLLAKCLQVRLWEGSKHVCRQLK